jgi:hypothetical protein
MADKLNPGSTGAIDAAALKRSVKDINKHREAAQESAGLVGKATQSACETYNFNKTALTFCARLVRKEQAQQLEVLGAIVSYAQLLGMFDGSDMFNSHVAAMKAVIEAAENGVPGAKAPGATLVGQLAGAQH